MKYSIIVGQSGGPTAAINASLLGLVKTSLNDPEVEHVYGALNGIDGLLKGQIIDFKDEDLTELEKLKTTPSSALGSVRFKLSDYQTDTSVYEKLCHLFMILNIKMFFYIGGNDSMDTCCKIASYLMKINFPCQVIGIPKTIDNDLVETDHTPGYGSAIKYIATTISEIKADISAYQKGKVTFVEIMGRDAGWLTAGSKLASLNGNGPDLIYLPEGSFSLKMFLEKVENIYAKKGHVLVALSEGLKDQEGRYLLTYRSFNSNDDFGHLQLGGVGEVLAEKVNQVLKLPIRSIELNIPQRCAIHAGSLTDLDEAYECGKWAFLYAKEGYTNQMVIMKRISSFPYQIEYQLVSLEKVANLVKKVPLDYLNKTFDDVTEQYLDYALPLIKGEVKINYENGLPKFVNLKKKIISFNKN